MNVLDKCLDVCVQGSLDTGLRRLSQLGRWLGDLSFAKFTILVLSIELMRLGLSWQREPVFGYREWASSWPNGSSWDTSPLWTVWSRFGLTDSILWPISWIVTVVLTLIVISFLGHNYLTSWQARFLVLSVLASGIPIRLMEGLGHYDVLFLLASVSLAFPVRIVWIAAAVTGGLANAEVAVVAGLSVILAGLAFRNATNVKRGLALAGFGVLVTLSVRIATEVSGAQAGGRTSVFLEGVVPSLVGNLAWLPLILATGYLGAWFVVLLIIIGMPTARQMLLLIAGLLIIPGLMTLVTLDGTRVFVVTSAAAMTLTIQTWIAEKSSWVTANGQSTFPASTALALLFAIFILVPETSVFVLDSEVRLAPWQFLLDVLYAVQPEFLP